MFYICIFYVLYFIYSICHNFIKILIPKKYDKITGKTLEENPNTVARNLIEESQKSLLKGEDMEKKELVKFITNTDMILEKIKLGKFTHSEYVVYSKLIYMLYFAVNHNDSFNKVKELHEPYTQSLQAVKVIITNSNFYDKKTEKVKERIGCEQGVSKSDFFDKFKDDKEKRDV
jgi:hypothetical protein